MFFHPASVGVNLSTLNRSTEINATLYAYCVCSVWISTTTADFSGEFSVEPLAVAVSPYGWLMTHYGWLAG